MSIKPKRIALTLALLGGLLSPQVTLAQIDGNSRLMLQMIQGGVRDSAGALDQMRQKLLNGGLSTGQADRVVQEIDRLASSNVGVGGKTQAIMASIRPALRNIEFSQEGDVSTNEWVASRSRRILLD